MLLLKLPYVLKFQQALLLQIVLLSSISLPLQRAYAADTTSLPVASQQLTATQAQGCWQVLGNPDSSKAQVDDAMKTLTEAIGVQKPKSSPRSINFVDVGASTPAADAAIKRMSLINDPQTIAFVQAVNEYKFEQPLNDALEAGRTGQWTRALADYQKVEAAPDPASFSKNDIDLLRSEVEGSKLLVQDLTEDAPNGNGTFLGVDRTIDGSWLGTVGTTAWVLFGIHGQDLVGGPALLDNSFTYHPYIVGSNTSVRRRRDPDGTMEPYGDLLLTDPGLYCERASSYLDDNGEVFPYRAGPDLYVNFTVPSGHYVLSLPIRFSQRSDGGSFAAPYYGLFLLTDASTGVTSGSQCVGWGTVTPDDIPGFARFAVTGPASYTLLVTRATSSNVNLQALYLDRDLRYDQPPSLEDAFGLSAVRSVDSAVDGAEGANFTKLMSAYGRAAAQPSVADWTSIAKAAATVTDGLQTRDLRAEAAYIAWQAQQRTDLDSGDTDSFRKYLDSRYPSNTPYEGQSVGDLLSFAGELRSEGRWRLAEIADDIAWDDLVKMSPATSTQLQFSLISTLWTRIAKPYLTSETIQLAQGVGSTPLTVIVAADPSYTAQKANQIVNAVLENNFTTALLPESVNSTTQSSSIGIINYDDPAAFSARSCLDTIGDEAGFNVNGLQTTSGSGSSGLVQPYGAYVYIAAAEPLLGTEFSDHSSSTPAGQACLLSAVELETLSRALLNEDIFPSSQDDANKKLAARLLTYLKQHDPTYVRMDDIDITLSSLSPAH